MPNTCNPSVQVGGELPHRVNNTLTCGVNPYTSLWLLERCCQGPVTNITSPAPTSGPYSDSWPVTCLAYCAILIHPYYNETDSVVSQNFSQCLNSDSSFFGSYVCTEVDSAGPGECVPFQESVGCTDGTTHQTWGGSGYLSLSTAPVTTGTVRSTAQSTTGVMAASTTDGSLGTSATALPSASPTKSGAVSDLELRRFSRAVMGGLVLLNFAAGVLHSVW